jgi:hypothetical protein
LKCEGRLEMVGENGGKHEGHNLECGGGVEMVGERGGKHGGDNLKCGGRLGVVGETGVYFCIFEHRGGRCLNFHIFEIQRGRFFHFYTEEGDACISAVLDV